jgi:hypothetical protein
MLVASALYMVMPMFRLFCTDARVMFSSNLASMAWAHWFIWEWTSFWRSCLVGLLFSSVSSLAFCVSAGETMLLCR